MKCATVGTGTCCFGVSPEECNVFFFACCRSYRLSLLRRIRMTLREESVLSHFYWHDLSVCRHPAFNLGAEVLQLVGDLQIVTHGSLFVDPAQKSTLLTYPFKISSFYRVRIFSACIF